MELLCALFRSTFLFQLWPATLSLSLPTFMTTSRYCLIMILNIMLKQCCYYSRVIIYRKFIPFTLILEFFFFLICQSRAAQRFSSVRGARHPSRLIQECVEHVVRTSISATSAEPSTTTRRIPSFATRVGSVSTGSLIRSLKLDPALPWTQ